MFEAAELGRKLKKRDYNTRVPQLRTELLRVQRELREAGFNVLILLGGHNGAGKSEMANLLHEWMDARYLSAHAFGPPTQDEHERPEFWRYWRSLPPVGRAGVYVGSWYTDKIIDRALGKIDDTTLDGAMHRIAAFEQMLVDDNTLILKFWLHLSEKQQARRTAKLRKDPDTAWRVSKRHRKLMRRHGKFRRAAKRALRLTSTGRAPWTVVEAGDDRHRNVAIAEAIIARLQRHLAEQALREQVPTPETSDERPDATTVTVLDTIDLSQQIDPNTYDKALERQQDRLGRLAARARETGHSITAVFEGWDAAGKGGCIRRLIHPLDARFFRVIPISAPTEEERAYHYLWRFWRDIPRAGHVTIYDRSWYGRVLVERVEEFASVPQWQRAYKEINDFEEQLVERGTVLLKFWLQISPEEQLRRFEARRAVPWKRHKLTEDDWRNRKKAPQYVQAISEMIARTSTDYAPWTLISAESKPNARLRVLSTACDTLERALGPRERARR